MSRLTRRQFVRGALAAGGALALSGRRVLGANETIHVGCIGLGGRGGHSANEFAKLKGVRVAGFAEPDEQRLAGLRKRYPDAKAWADLRRMLDLNKPALRVRYELAEREPGRIERRIAGVLDGR